MKTLILLFLIMLVISKVPAAGQALVYDILLAGRDVGELKIAPAESNSTSESLRVEGAINTFLYDVVYVGENLFEKGILKTSLSTQEVNGRMKEKTKTIQTQGSYQVVFADAKDTRTKPPQLPHPINHTVTSLYYREPVNFRHVYSERFGKMCPVRKVAAGLYEVTMPDGKKATYHYRQGQCHKVESEIVGIGLQFKLRDTSVRR
ncbi:DUF6134 family protein [Telluribacter sp. SYSU D00476]|uniref:DUF6134 family protein n=1 Tax=Telluribacter sp. SYSU D00476 TaxID=2811430 RepID=UPI001FF105EB|nr:DUF6134 family protein [Telluribacter sp. SYSU D00476]